MAAVLYSTQKNMSDSIVGGTTVSNSDVCRYFTIGICRFGDMCRFAHVVVDTPEEEAAAATNNGSVDDGMASTTLFDEQQQQQQEPSDLANSTTVSENSQIRITPNDPCSWVMAPVFVPAAAAAAAAAAVSATTTVDEMSPTKSYAQVVGCNSTARVIYQPPDGGVPSTVSSTLCPFWLKSDNSALQCQYGEYCPYDHGEQCDMCGQNCLHPTNEEQRRQHRSECVRQHEADMELSFAIARSKDKMCGVCFEVVMEKSDNREQRFGILPNCQHIFCLACIRKWRQAKQFDNKIIRFVYLNSFYNLNLLTR